VEPFSIYPTSNFLSVVGGITQINKDKEDK
jgi:hypothetical protein